MDAEFVFIWKTCVNGVRHLGKYEKETGKWVKWEPQTNVAAVREANEHDRANPPPLPTSRP